LAKSQGIPLVPIAISGSETVLPKHGKLRSGRIKITMGEPLSAEEMKVMDLAGLRDEAYTRLQNLVREADNAELAVKPESA
jgi:1-acyl-sn-glycerol-3-phosphate acyltransferase